MNNSYLKLLIKSGIKALTGAAALAAAALILNSDDNNNKTSPQNSEKEAPEAAPKEEPPTAAEENASATAEKSTVKAAPQAAPVERKETLHTENSGQRQSIYVPDDREFKKADVIRVRTSEEQAIRLGLSFRKKSKSIRITNYHGTEKSIIIPTYIGGILVNEIGANAFKGSCVERVAIPDSVKKLGEAAFAESSVRFAVFGNGLMALPKMSFYNCKKLETIAIPPRTRKLGEKAFYGCGSLKYIELPRSLYEVGEDCFCGSGLEGFSAHFRYDSTFDGSAFANTPLHRNNELILYRRYDPANSNDEMKVMLVGYKADVFFEASKVYLGRNSVCAPCELDFSECKSISTINAFKCKPGYIDYTEEPPKIHIYVPEDGYCGSFPEFVDTSYDGWTTTLKTDCFCIARHIRINEDLCAYSLRLYGSMKITLDIDHQWIDTEAIIAQHLETLEINGDFRANGGIFAHVCRCLHEVKWNNSKGEFQSYIPSGQVIRCDVHRELLKAYCRRGFDGFFDSKIIENVFENGIIRKHSKTHLPLSRHEKILIAIDVLRSSPELYPEGTERYSQYLRRHINYARNMCRKVDHINYESPGYLEFLNTFASAENEPQDPVISAGTSEITAENTSEVTGKSDSESKSGI